MNIFQKLIKINKVLMNNKNKYKTIMSFQTSKILKLKWKMILPINNSNHNKILNLMLGKNKNNYKNN